MTRDPDPLEAITEPADDPSPEPITDPAHPDYVPPARGIRARRRRTEADQ
ncbi:hypothetical protein [Zhihengliuella sp.]|nr:hypothetical protein [Zhihengliuella sp.]